MHSGTHLLRYVILKAYDKTTPEDEHFFNGTSGNTMVTFHLNHDNFPKEYVELMERDDIEVFCPLRHPSRMWESYRKRLHNSAEGQHKRSKFELQWKRQMDLVDKYNPYYLHVDHEIRDHEVEIMAKVLDLPLKGDWRVNAKSGSVCGTHALDTNGLPPEYEYEAFYYETIERMKNIDPGRI